VVQSYLRYCFILYMCTIYVSFISSILYFEFHRIMQHEYIIYCGNMLATPAYQKHTIYVSYIHVNN